MYMHDMGRQRVTKYVSRKFQNGLRIQQFQHEMSKMKSFTKSETEEPPKTENKKEPKALCVVPETPKTTNEIESPIPEKLDNSSSLDAARKILGKYKLKALKRSYQKSFCNVAELGKNSDGLIKRRKIVNCKKDVPGTLGIEELREKLSVVSDPKNQPAPRPNDIISLKDLASSDTKATGTNVTYRLLKRANIIVEAVKKHKVIDDMTKLMKVIFV